jgi:hypothetical protein
MYIVYAFKRSLERIQSICQEYIQSDLLNAEKTTIERQADRQTERQTGRQTDTQIDRQTDRHTS